MHHVGGKKRVKDEYRQFHSNQRSQAEWFESKVPSFLRVKKSAQSPEQYIPYNE
jgi:hypothetical protein